MSMHGLSQHCQSHRTGFKGHEVFKSFLDLKLTMYPTKYHKANSLQEAIELYKSSQDASFLSGGHTLLPVMKQGLAAPSDLIDLSFIDELKGIEVTPQTVVISSMTRHMEVASNDDVIRAVPCLAALAGSIGDRQVRFRGTIGGSLANNDPAADYTAGFLGLGGHVETNLRSIAAEEFFVSMFQTALKPGEIIKRVHLSIPKSAGYAKFRAAAARYSMVGVFIARTELGTRVAVTGAGQSGVYREKSLEAALDQKFDATSLEGIQISSQDLIEDMHASSLYRANLIKVLAKHAVLNMGGMVNLK